MDNVGHYDVQKLRMDKGRHYDVEMKAGIQKGAL